MSELSTEKRDEVRDNIVFDALNNLTSRFHNSMRQDLKLINDYITGRIVPHLHMRVRCRKGDPASRDYCAIYQWPSEECLRFGNHRPWATEGAVSYRRLNDVKSAVLVDVTKLVKFPKRVKMIPLAAMIRLQPLNDCLCTWDNGLDLPHPAPSIRSAGFITLPVQRFVPKDGELCSSQDFGGNAGVGRRQVVRQMVERGPRVVQEIPEKQGDSWGWFQIYAEASSYDDITANLLLNLILESVRVSVNIGGNFIFERLQTLLRPVEFESDVVYSLHVYHVLPPH